MLCGHRLFMLDDDFASATVGRAENNKHHSYRPAKLRPKLWSSGYSLWPYAFKCVTLLFFYGPVYGSRVVMAFLRWFVSVCFSFSFDTCYDLATSVVCTVSYSHLLTLLFTPNILW